MADDLLRAASEIAVLDLAGAIIANPNRAMCSQAGKLALAYATANFWAMALEGAELARLHQRRQFILSGEAGPEGDEDMDAVCFRMDALAASLIAKMRAATQTETNKQETDDGSRHS